MTLDTSPLVIAGVIAWIVLAIGYLLFFAGAGGVSLSIAATRLGPSISIT